ncbi:hypothetical protein BIY24_01885 [Halobacteriovorax marinus]|nr:hypothetical protein BIY24_01885 [Halobacteriovorax marinus]
MTESEKRVPLLNMNLYLLLIMSSIIYFQFSWLEGFFQDGYLYAALGKNAAEKGRWLVPHLTPAWYSEFNDHTNFTFILEGLFFKIFGASYTTARIFAGLFSIFTGLSVYIFLGTIKKKNIAYLAFLFFILIPPLMKKSRFPNIDLPLMLFFTGAMFSYWKAYVENKFSYWILCGFFFGLCTLTKGPMGALVPIVIFFHLLSEKSIGRLRSKWPWLGLFLGFLIFMIWPVSLHLGDKFYIFERWFEFTILGSIMKSRGVSEPWYTYIVFLLKNVNVIFLLCLVGIYKNLKSEKDSFISFCSVILVTVLGLLSLQGLKYSNYLIPIYPFLAILAAFGIVSLWKNAQDRLMNVFQYLIPLAAVILLVFPLTSKTRRDPEITKLKEILKLSSRNVSKWIVYNNSYPFWSLASKNGFEDGSVTITLEKNDDVENCEECIVLIKDEDSSGLSKKEEFSSYYLEAFYLKKKRVRVYLPKKRKIGIISI